MIAPDYPGFGNSDMPDPKTFPYTFDKTSEIIESFLKKVGFTRFGLYVQDYGGPVGFRIVTRRPEWLEWLIIQNTNAYEVGFTAVWDGLRGAYWKNRTAEAEKPLEAFLQPDTVKLVYTHGHPKPELISPDNWNMDLHYLDRPNARRVQLDFFYDYTNVQLYPKWQAFLRDRQKLFVGCGNQCAGIDAGVVHEDVEAAKRLDRRRHCAFATSYRRDIAGRCDHTVSPPNSAIAVETDPIVRPLTATRMPRSRKAFVVALPIPREAPVTRAIL